MSTCCNNSQPTAGGVPGPETRVSATPPAGSSSLGMSSVPGPFLAARRGL